jgi:tRNA-Thr(GGU) m(6)t(6)A37 methyltransferase TsaA
MPYTFEPIGFIESPFKEKFGVPRQSQLVPEARSTLRLEPGLSDAVLGLEGFSHVWVLFVFHGNLADGWNPLVRPPRLGGAAKMGVFATRAPHRPNPIGMSLVKLERVERTETGPVLHFSGGDFLDGTPVLDLKPHFPEADRARGTVRIGWLETAPEWPSLEVEFAPAARAALARLAGEGYPDLEALLVSTLRRDPRPAFQRDEDADYAMRIADDRLDVHWVTEGNRCRVVEIRDLRETDA